MDMPNSTSSSSSSSSDAGRRADELDAHIASIRAKELPQFATAASDLYLDAAAAPPFPSAALLGALHGDLTSSLYSNPHSGAPAAQRTARAIDAIRTKVLTDIFNLDPSNAAWDIIFTSGTTASLKLVAESFVWAEQRGGGQYVYLNQSHTSLSGLRSYALAHGAEVEAVDEQELLQRVREGSSTSGNTLVALPLQCNATGRRFVRLARDVAAAREAQSSMQLILLDASAFLSSSTRWPSEQWPLSGTSAPDFIAFSFYKIFGYPTGLGGLLVRRHPAVHSALAGKHFYGGGTLALSLPYRKIEPASAKGKEREQTACLDGSIVPSRSIIRRLEDGTANFYGIIAVKHAMDTHDALLKPPGSADQLRSLDSQWALRRSHVRSLTRRLFRGLGALRHGPSSHQDQEPDWLVQAYTQSSQGQRWLEQGRNWARRRSVGPDNEWQSFLNGAEDEFQDEDDQGPIALFNLLAPRPLGTHGHTSTTIISPFEVGRLASLLSIHLRVGRHCNAGAMQDVVGVTRERMWNLWRNDGVGCVGEEDPAEHMDQGDSDDQVGAALAERDDDDEVGEQDDHHPGAAVRASLCTWNTQTDIDALLDFLRTYFVSTQSTTADQAQSVPAEQSSDASQGPPDVGYLRSMVLYPIKSCTGQHFGQPFSTVVRQEPQGWTAEAQCAACGCIVLQPVWTDDSKVAAAMQRSESTSSTTSRRSMRYAHSDASQSDATTTGRAASSPPSSLPPSDCGDGASVSDETQNALSKIAWPLTPHGLLHDREWCITTIPGGPGKKGRILSQKKHTRMALIRARVQRSFSGYTDEDRGHVGSLVIDLMKDGGDEYERRLVIPFGDDPACQARSCELRRQDGDATAWSASSAVCAAEGKSSITTDGPEPHPCYLVQHVLSDFLNVDCTLARLSSASGRHRHSNLSAASNTASGGPDGHIGPVPILLSNESPFLLVRQESVDAVQEWVRADGRGSDIDYSRVNASCFRPNFVIAGPLPPHSEGRGSETEGQSHPEPLPEDGLRRVQIGPHSFGALGPCRRCEMVGIDQETGERVPQTLAALSKRRRRLQGGGRDGTSLTSTARTGRVEFGEHLHWLQHVSHAEPGQKWQMVSIGMPVSWS